MAKEKVESKEVKPPEVPKIASMAVIKKAEIKPECGNLSFDGFDFTAEQYEQVADWVKGKERLLVTIEPMQGRLDFEED